MPRRLTTLAIALALALPAFATEPPVETLPAEPAPAEAPPIATPIDDASVADVTPPVAPATDEPITTLETLVVTGIQPGPGLWQVRQGDNTLWIMATLTPLPRRMEWEPRELDALVARADRVLAPPRVEVDADIGFFGRLTLIPSALRARNNPDDQTLAEVLPSELYARWQVQKAQYLGRDRGIEDRRPFIAAYELMEEALEDLDLKRENIVWPRVQRVARREDREIVTPEVSVQIPDPREALREFEKTGVNDLGCMEATLTRLENDTDAMVERANAWAVGDIRTLQELRFESEIRACGLALLGSDALKKRGFTDLPQRLVAEWARVAAESLANHKTTVGVADYLLLTNPDGLLAALRAKGFEVLAPGEGPTPDEAAKAEVDTDTATPTPPPGG